MLSVLKVKLAIQCFHAEASFLLVQLAFVKLLTCCRLQHGLPIMENTYMENASLFMDVCLGFDGSVELWMFAEFPNWGSDLQVTCENPVQEGICVNGASILNEDFIENPRTQFSVVVNMVQYASRYTLCPWEMQTTGCMSPTFH